MEGCGPSKDGKSYFFNGITAELDGSEIYCVVSDGQKTIASSSALIQVYGSKMPPTPIKVPASVSIPKNYGDGILKLACQTDFTKDYTFQWYETFTGKLQNIQAIDCTDPIIYLPTSEVGTKYYVCMVSAPDGGFAYSSVIPVTIYEKETPASSDKPAETNPSGGSTGETKPDENVNENTGIKILLQPVDVNTKNGENITFSCKAEGNVKYQWWCSEGEKINAPGNTAYKLSDGGNYTKTDTDTLNVNADASMDGKYYICEITAENDDKVFSNSAKLSVENVLVEPSSNGLSSEIIIIICLAIALLIAIIIAIILFVKTKKQNNKKEKEN